MALTRQLLEDLAVPADAIQRIIDEHTATTGRINGELKDAKAQLADAQKDLDAYKTGDWEAKYNAEHTALEALRGDIAAKETRSKKESALKAYYEGKKITGANLRVAMRGTDLAAIEIDDAGKIKDTKALDDLVTGDFAGLVAKTERVIDTGAHVGDNAGASASYSLKDALRDSYQK